MNAPTLFQLHYPLSPKKFWKKVVPKAIIGFLVFGFVVPVLMSVYSPYQTLGDLSIIRWSLLLYLAIYALWITIYAVYIKAYIRRYYYDANDNFLSIQKGVFTPTEIHVQYSKIQDVYVDQDLFDRILGICDVHIASATATSGIEAHIDGVDTHVAEALKNLILAKIQHRAAGSSPEAEQSFSVPTPDQPISIDGEVSSRTYPIDARYLQEYLLSSISFVLIWSIILYFAAARFYTIIFTGETSPIALPFIGYFFIALGLRVFGLIYNILWIQNFYFSFEPEYILVKKGIIAKEERHVPYRTIQDVTLSQGILDRAFGLSNVSIENATNLGATGAVGSAAVSIPGLSLAHGQGLVRIVNQITKSRADHGKTGL